MESGIELFNKIMTSAMEIPSIKVDRRQFLVKELTDCCTDKQLAQALINPTRAVSPETIDLIAKACISFQTKLATAISAAAGFPGLWGVPADMAQFYGNTLIMAQKLAYLYGYPDLKGENGELSEEAKNTLILCLGVMMGSDTAKEALDKVSKFLVTEPHEGIPQIPSTEVLGSSVVKEVSEWIGIKMTKDVAAKATGRTIPIIGAAVSGALTYTAFREAAKRLQKTLKKQMQDRLEV